MKKNRVIKSGIKNMVRHKMRTFFMMIGVVIGITALTLIISLGKGTEKEVMNNIERMFSASNILISAGGGRMMGGPQSGGPTTTLTISDIEALQASIPNIDMWDPMQMIFGREVKYKEKSTNLRIFGHSPTAEEVWNRSVSSGTFFTQVEMESSARVALIGEIAVQELFGDEDPLNKQIRIGTVPFRIIGVLEPMGTDPHGMDRDNEIHAPITTVMRRLMNVDYIMSAKLHLRDPEQMDENVDDITRILRKRHSLAEREPNDFSIMTPVEVQEMVSAANRIFNLFLPLVAGISLVVGGVIVATLMLISVNERTSEIGLRKAVGARAKDILLQFIIETTVITFSGGVIGILLGILGVLFMASMMQVPAFVSWQALVLGVGFSFGVGLIAGVGPARRAAALDPVETL